MERGERTAVGSNPRRGGSPASTIEAKALHTLTLDGEMAALVFHALEVLDALLGVRADRIDPEGTITKTRNLQRTKVTTMLAQLQQPAFPEWDDLPGEVRKQIVSAAIGLSTAQGKPTQPEKWRKLAAGVITARLVSMAVPRPPTGPKGRSGPFTPPGTLPAPADALD